MAINDLEILEAVLLATKEGRIVWAQPQPGEFHGNGPIRVVIKEVCPLIAGDPGDPETVGVQAFELEIGGLILYFWAGTIGMSKLHEILALGLPEWSTHLNNFAGRKAAVLRKLLNDNVSDKPKSLSNT